VLDAVLNLGGHAMPGALCATATRTIALRRGMDRRSVQFPVPPAPAAIDAAQ
jgi:hypothetical protein